MSINKHGISTELIGHLRTVIRSFSPGYNWMTMSKDGVALLHREKPWPNKTGSWQSWTGNKPFEGAYTPAGQIFENYLDAKDWKKSLIDLRAENDKPKVGKDFSLEDYLSTCRRIAFDLALELGNQSEAARMLGVTPQAVHKYIKTAKEQ